MKFLSAISMDVNNVLKLPVKSLTMTKKVNANFADYYTEC